ncbi:PREDICTED: uncharacterized protein LOC109330888 [Lupinus angustifolius]|uniref:uncharacterized protein LOC109330888 n=1 Tax=Lupinus angustifolius TaxID=3871 RepID=UPI00092E304A|nr:PREDICTED: uncharacterized protein LOC109330888 [Lupinus angustifolius]
MEEDYKPVAQPQRRLNLIMKEVVKKEVMKLLDAEMIYPIYDGKWVSPVQVVPKKGDRCGSPRLGKIAFTSPFGVFAYRKMPGGLCNAPTTFQRCMLAIFLILWSSALRSLWMTSRSSGRHLRAAWQIWTSFCNDVLRQTWY